MSKVTGHDFGDQPLHTIMQLWQLTNHDLVEISTEQLTHKQVQRARRGRKLSLKMMQKITRALNVTIWNKLNAPQKENYHEYAHRELFNYAKGYNPDRQDTNHALAKEYTQ